MGRIRQTYIKKIAFEILAKRREELTPDFTKNKEVVDKFLNIESKFIRNKIAGYVTHLVKIKSRATEVSS